MSMPCPYCTNYNSERTWWVTSGLTLVNNGGELEIKPIMKPNRGIEESDYKPKFCPECGRRLRKD